MVMITKIDSITGFFCLFFLVSSCFDDILSLSQLPKYKCAAFTTTIIIITSTTKTLSFSSSSSLFSACLLACLLTIVPDHSSLVKSGPTVLTKNKYLNLIKLETVVGDQFKEKQAKLEGFSKYLECSIAF